MSKLMKITFAFVAVLALGFVYVSCGDDEETPEAPNQKFIGNYEGSFACTPPFDVINQDMVEFEISGPVDPNETQKVTISFVVTGIPVSLDATVSGNNLNFDPITLENIPFETGGITVDATLTFSGNAVLNNDQITANLNVIADLGGGITLSSACTLIGNKQ